MDKQVSWESMLAALPQAAHCPSDRQRDWIVQGLANDPEGFTRQAQALSGFLPEELGVLVSAQAGQFHPTSDARQITRAKLLLDAPPPPNAAQQRARALGDMVRAAYRAQQQATGWVFDAQRTEQLAHAHHPHHPWMQPGQADVFVKEGQMRLTSYRLPSQESFEEGRGQPVALHHKAALHHLWALAQALGWSVTALEQASFCAQAWAFDVAPVVPDAAFQEHCLAVGAQCWEQFVLSGHPAPEVMVNQPQALDELTMVVAGTEVTIPVLDTEAALAAGKPVYIGDYGLDPQSIPKLQQQLQSLGTEIFGFALLKSEAEKSREILTQAVRDALPMHALPVDMSRVDLGPVRLKTDWRYHEDRLVEAARGALALLGQGNEEIETLLESDNFYHPQAFALQPLLEILRAKGIDVEHDPDFAPARVGERARRTDTLVALLRDLEKALPEGVQWRELVDFEASRLGVELVRAPMAGFGKALREETASKLRQAALPAVRTIAQQHVKTWQEEQARQAEVDPPPAARRRRAKP